MFSWGALVVESECPQISSESRTCANAFSDAESRSCPNVPATAFRASQPPLDDRDLPRPVPALAKQRDLHRVDDGDALAGPAFDPQPIAVPRIVRDRIEPFRAHGLRRIAHTRADIAVSTAARPASAGGSRTSMATFRFDEGGYMFTFCSV